MSVRTPTTTESGRSSRPIGVPILVAAFVFLAFTALYGGAALVAAPDGSFVDAVVPVDQSDLAGTPFDDYTVPGVVLIVAIGVVPLVAAYGLSVRTEWAWYGAVAVSVLLLGWLAVEYLLLGYFSVLQPLYALFALGLLALTFAPPVRAYFGIGP
ncbi:MAG TPA: hypothetical protein VJ898_00150 [Natrialbaceae archaeon]|nr:hypothetical protein [Natrialbaceae archaeon]